MHNFTLFILSFFTLLYSNTALSINSVKNNSESNVIMDSDLIITEIMYNPSGSDTKWEWIEIYNDGTSALDLTGYVIDDNSTVQLSSANITSGILPAGESAILFDADDVTAEQFAEVWGNVNLIAVNNWSTLGNGSGDTIGIWSSYENYDDDNQAHLNAVEKVTYLNNEGGWPNDDGNSSIYLIDLSSDNTIGSNWALSEEGVATPLNTAYTSSAANENSGTDVGSPGTMAIDDTTPPEIECPETVEINHDLGLCSSEIPLLEPNATDDVSTEFVVEGVRSDGLELFEPFPVGFTTITWTVTDEAGNTSESCDQLLIVIEDEAPTAIGQNITVELDENGLATINPLELDNGETPSFDNCGVVAYFASRTEFNCDDLEAPVDIEFSVEDANGNTSALTNVQVTVIDTIKPNISCSADINAISSNGNPVQLEQIPEPNITDNCDSEPIVSGVRSDNGELTDPYPVGLTTIIWKATDASGNVVECSQNITITVPVDTTPPTFDVDGNVEDFTTELEVGNTYEVGSILNIVDDNITVSNITGAELVDTSISGGSFLVIYEVSDGTNATTITETVLVSASSNPAISGFVLVNADTNEDIFEITQNMQIDLNSLPTLNLNIRANASENTMSVVLNLSGTMSNSRTENVVPYALFGDFPQGIYYGREFMPGSYTLTATAHSENRAQGIAGLPRTIDFSIFNVCDSFDVGIVDQFDTSTCGGSDGFILLYADGTAPFRYTWSHDSTLNQNVAINIPSGMHSVGVTDANGCNTEIIFEIKDPQLPEVSLTPFENVEVNTAEFALTGGFPEGGTYSGQGVVNGNFDPAIGKGTYEITYSYTDAQTNCENSAVQSIIVSQSVLSVQSFTLVNADTDEDILQLTEGLQVDIASLPTLNLNIRANTTNDVESVMLQLSGAISNTRTENVAPYALFGDFPAGQYFSGTFVAGQYSIVAKPYSENLLGGQLGTALSLNFEFFDSDGALRISNSANIFPNPAKEKTTLQFENPAELRTIFLYDVLGRVVATYDGQAVKKDEAYELDVSSIPAGNYHIKTYDNQGKAHQKQLIIEK